jgi:hypothetical protein
MGNLTIGSNALTVNSDDTSGQPYVLAFTNTTITTGGNPVFHINASATGGAGTVVLDTAAGQVAIPSAALAGAQAMKPASTFNSLSVDSGTVALQPRGTVVVTAALNLTGNGTLNLTNNDLLLHEADNAEAGIRALLHSAYNNGKWDGPGLTSSGAGATVGMALGYSLASNLGVSSFDGQSAVDPSIVVKLVAVGDTNLDGFVNADDVQNIVDHYDPTHLRPQDWLQGDFNYDGYTDAADLDLLASLYSANSASPITAAQFGQLQSIEASGTIGAAVPEPSSVAVIGVAACALSRRRPRRSVGG